MMCDLNMTLFIFAEIKPPNLWLIGGLELRGKQTIRAEGGEHANRFAVGIQKIMQRAMQC